MTFDTEEEKLKFIEDVKATGRSVSGFLKYAGLKVLKNPGLLILFFSLPALAQDTICLPKRTYTEIYKSLKAGEYYRSEYDKCISVSEQLNNTIKNQNDSLQMSLYRLDEVNYELDYLNYQYQEQLKKDSKKWTFGAAGFISGFLVGLIFGSL